MNLLYLTAIYARSHDPASDARSVLGGGA
jgi:hypothetical protein